jgi:hypothetical protein
MTKTTSENTALKHYAETAPIAIFDDELIVGRPCTWLGKWGMVYPELDGEVMLAGMEMFRKNKGKSGEIIITEEDEKSSGKIMKNLFPYPIAWKKGLVPNQVLKLLKWFRRKKIGKLLPLRTATGLGADCPERSRQDH